MRKGYEYLTFTATAKDFKEIKNNPTTKLNDLAKQGWYVVSTATVPEISATGTMPSTPGFVVWTLERSLGSFQEKVPVPSP